jgi:triacylglycerol lipase
VRRVLTRLVVAVAAFAVVVGAIASGGPPVGAASRVPRQDAGRRDPVLLVHGFNGSGAGWHAMVASLEQAGWRADQIDAMTYDSTGSSNVDIAHRIAEEVATLRARTGAARVDVVSHSMGAISTRWYLEHLGGTASVDAWVSLGGVNEGTVWAYGCYVLTPCREMVPTSSVLHDLADRFPPRGDTRYATWWSPCDEAVVPTSNAKLAGARNTETACLGHSALKSDPVVLAQVRQFLTSRVN